MSHRAVRPRREGEKPRPSQESVSSKLATAIIVTILALIVVVVLVGLYRDDLDPLGVITVLGTMVTGFVSVLVARGRGDR
jgi:hypothetical protein